MSWFYLLFSAHGQLSVLCSLTVQLSVNRNVSVCDRCFEQNKIKWKRLYRSAIMAANFSLFKFSIKDVHVVFFLLFSLKCFPIYPISFRLRSPPFCSPPVSCLHSSCPSPIFYHSPIFCHVGVHSAHWKVLWIFCPQCLWTKNSRHFVHSFHTGVEQ